MTTRTAGAPRPTVAAAAALAAAGFLARAIHLRDGLFAEVAFPWLAGACVFGSAPLWLPARVRDREIGERPFLGLALTILAWQFLALFRHRIASQTAADAGVGTPWFGNVALAVGAGAALCVAADRAPRRALVVALAAFAVVGVWLLRATPEPHIDVWHFQQAGCEAFLRGESPYAASIRDIYDNPAGYGPGLVRDGRVLIGFQYPPVVFWPDLLGYVATGDYRYAQLVAWLGAAALLFLSARDRVGRLAALLLLFTPRAFFVLEFGWPEPVVVGLLAAVVFASRRGSAALPWIVGLFFASRQYLILAAPLALALLPRPLSARTSARFLGRATLAAVVATLPLAVWDFEALAKCVWRVQAAMPPRPDALSFLALYASRHDGAFPPYYGGFALLLLAVLGALLRGARGAADVCLALGGGYVLFFAFNKFAFCNYYVSALAALTAGAISTRSRPADLPR